ncbi:hypothetical protein E3J48_02580 [Candidatus Aerophobetes bacterium]|uniref:Uncharacterized protein n=1 Tax=Aerophobetes bacterium TaxID=2030807 RepID=A0A523W8P7_UNCAE|nr:MAG: hypothetical protein E3J48_02580 [Candidatus Aerophobetes bacterium]
MEVECPTCGRKVEFKLSDKDTLFSLQDCVVCKVNFTQIIRNLKIVDGKITGEIVGTEEICGVDLNKGESDDG